ncbi:high mobility group protein 20A-like [Teleopsis dalmanni]|uniref:high mobility group protein 20A-like n=1 Tax=Teleopsis dalmanni TaxID=139649 RepID=UPI0018CEE3ED|nr:high mobility group protein 20A-like [Teleopsis dalmanni]
MEAENLTGKMPIQLDVVPNNKGKVDNVTVDINPKVATPNKGDVVSEVSTDTIIEPEKSNDVHPAVLTLSDTEEPSQPAKSSKKRKSTSSFSTSVYDDQILKRRKIKVAGAPKMPVTGYVRYMNERRETMRKEFPTKTAMEHTRMIAEEWGQLSEERKAPYIKAAAIERKKYLADLQVFLKAHPDVLASELAKNKPIRKGENKTVLKEKQQSNGNKSVGKENDKEKLNTQEKELTPSPPIQATTQNRDKTKRKRTPTPVNNNTNNNSTNNSNVSALAATVPGEIIIFTNEFLDHNKVHDMELRTLRKSKADLEQQNAVLEKHVENMKFGVEKMANENNELEEKNRLLELYLGKLKVKLAHAFATLPLPMEPNGANTDNIEKYMSELYKMATSNTHGPACLNKAKDILRKLDLQIQL